MGDSHQNKSLCMFTTKCVCVCVCVCLYALQLPSGFPAALWEPIALQQSWEGMVTRGYESPWIKQWVFSSRGPLVVAVTCRCCGLQPQLSITSARPSPPRHDNTQWACGLSLLRPCRVDSPSLPSFLPTPRRHHCRASASRPQLGFLDTGSRDGAATSLHSLASSLSLSLSVSVSLAVSLSPPERLLHHCSATINSSVQISCKLPKQTSVLTSAPQHTHTHRSPKFRPPQKQHTHTHTNTHRPHTLLESLSHTHRTMQYWYLLDDPDGNRQTLPPRVFDLIAADINTHFLIQCPPKMAVQMRTCLAVGCKWVYPHRDSHLLCLPHSAVKPLREGARQCYQLRLKEPGKHMSRSCVLW